MNEPLISVIVPVYKVEPYLERCVNSVRNQTYRNLEIILVDDGSPDCCGEMCDRYAQEDARIQVIHKQNGGLSSARNAGLDVMTGEYVGFVDSDDWIAEDMIAVLYNLITSDHVEIACCGIERVNSQGHVSYFYDNVEEHIKVDSRFALGELLHNNRITNSLCDKLFHRSVFDGLRMTEGYIYEDYDLMYRCIGKVSYVAYTGKPLYCYYLSDGSILRGNMSKKHYDLVPVGQKRLAYYEKHCPEHLPLAKAKYIEIALGLIDQTRNTEDCVVLRKELAQEVKRMLAEPHGLPLTKNAKIKTTALRIGLPVYTLLMSMYNLVRR